MTKRRKQRLRGRALAAKAAEASRLRREVADLTWKVSHLQMTARTAREDALNDVTRRLFDRGRCDEEMMQYAMRRMSAEIGEILGKEVGAQFKHHSKTFAEMEKVGAQMLRRAATELRVSAVMPMETRGIVELRFDIPSCGHRVRLAI